LLAKIALPSLQSTPFRVLLLRFVTALDCMGFDFSRFAVQVSNIEANRPLTLAGVRIVVTARKKRPQPAPSNGRLPVFVQPPSPMLQLVSLVLNPVNIPTGVTTLEMEAQIQVVRWVVLCRRVSVAWR
jgi:hypothetical protein